MFDKTLASWLAVASILVAGCSSAPSPSPSSTEVTAQDDSPPPVAVEDTPPITAAQGDVARAASGTMGFGAPAPGDKPLPSKECAGKACGEPCPSMFGSPLPTFCDAAGQCRPSKPVCDGPYDCDLSQIMCDAMQPVCPDGMTPSRAGACYGPCVPIGACACTPGKPSHCPEGSVCHAGTNRCGPYVN